MPHKVTLPTTELQLGMFVSDLDRPWIETPFLLQGFLIETEAEIATLQQYCRSVTVDRSRSLGEAYTPRHNDKDDLRHPAESTIAQGATKRYPLTLSRSVGNCTMSRSAGATTPNRDSTRVPDKATWRRSCSIRPRSLMISRKPWPRSMSR